MTGVWCMHNSLWTGYIIYCLGRGYTAYSFELKKYWFISEQLYMTSAGFSEGPQDQGCIRASG